LYVLLLLLLRLIIVWSIARSIFIVGLAIIRVILINMIYRQLGQFCSSSKLTPCPILCIRLILLTNLLSIPIPYIYSRYPIVGHSCKLNQLRILKIITIAHYCQESCLANLKSTIEYLVIRYACMILALLIPDICYYSLILYTILMSIIIIM
jgi:hypothetical protein